MVSPFQEQQKYSLISVCAIQRLLSSYSKSFCPLTYKIINSHFFLDSIKLRDDSKMAAEAKTLLDLNEISFVFVS